MLAPLTGQQGRSTIRDSELVANLNAPLVAVDADGRITRWNPAAEAQFGWSAEEVLHREARELIARPADAGDGERVRELLDQQGTWEGEVEVRRKDGSTFPAYTRAALIRGDDGEPRGMVGVLLDVTERRRAERQLERRVAQQAAVAELGRRGLGDRSLDELFEDATNAVRETLGVEFCALLELTPEGDSLVVRTREARGEIIPADQSQAGYTLVSGEPVIVEDWRSETRFRMSQTLASRDFVSGVSVAIPGRERPFGVLGAQTREPRAFESDDVHFFQSIANVLADAIEQRRSEERLSHQALHDPLTGLANRVLLLDRLGHALARASRSGDRVAVLFLDVDNFKTINDSLGHEAGDALLLALAPRLSGTVRPSDTVARFGGDEFVAVCEDVGGEREAIAIAERIAAACREPIAVGGHEHRVEVSIGIALSGAPGATPESLLRDADLAMYRAKQRGRNRNELFDEHLRTRLLERLRVESELRPALERGELRLHYQPIVSLGDGELVGVEALLRWQHPARGLVAPGEFIAVAEDTGLIVPIGAWALEEACRQAARWQEAGLVRGPFAIGVNLSPRQVAHSAIAATAAAAVARAGLDPVRLALEITETVLVEEGESVLAELERLKALGAALVLDDFGTGYSSLSHLRHFPIDALKIDRSFIRDLDDDAETAAIVEGVMGMARALRLTAVAEGVETEQQLERLRRLGCTRAQGYLFARPQPAEELTLLLEGAAAEGQPLLLLPAGRAASAK